MSSQFCAGFYRRNITPAPNYPNGIWMAQRHLRAKGIHRSLYVSSIFLGNSNIDEGVIILAYDLTILSAAQISEIHEGVAASTGIPAERVHCFVTHNHAAPVTQDFYVGEGEGEVREYIKFLIAQSVIAAENAYRCRQQSLARAGQGYCRIGVNRDLLLDGRIVTGPNPDGFADPEVGVVRIDDLKGSPAVAIVTYGCHPTYLGPDNELVSPDFPGVMRDIFEEVSGVPCVFLQGGGGNVGPMRGFLGDTSEVERNGRILACEAAKVFLDLDTRYRTPIVTRVVESGAPLGLVDDKPLDSQIQEFDYVAERVLLPTDAGRRTVYSSVEKDLARASEELSILEQDHAPDKELRGAIQRRLRHQLRAERKRVYFEKDVFPVRVMALRLGQCCVVSVACEAFAEIGHEIKRKSPYDSTVFAAYEGPDVIYVAPAEYYEEPVSMEVFNSPFSARAAEMLVDRAVALLSTLKERERPN